MSLKTEVLNDSSADHAVETEDIKRILAGISGISIDAIQDDHTLTGDLAWDSLDQVECAMEIEEQFDVSVPEDMMDGVHTVRDAIDGVLRLLAERDING